MLRKACFLWRGGTGAAGFPGEARWPTPLCPTPPSPPLGLAELGPLSAGCAPPAATRRHPLRGLGALPRPRSISLLWGTRPRVPSGCEAAGEFVPARRDDDTRGRVSYNYRPAPATRALVVGATGTTGSSDPSLRSGSDFTRGYWQSPSGLPDHRVERHRRLNTYQPGVRVGCGVDPSHRRPQHFLCFFPLPQGQGSFGPIFGSVRRIVDDSEWGV